MKRFADILKEVSEGRRLTSEEALILFTQADLIALGRAAQQQVERRFPEGRVTFVIDRNINYTNVCTCKCSFCAFYREIDDPDAYLLSPSEVAQKVEEAVQQGATQIMLQGGLHPELSLDYVISMIKAIKDRFKVVVHSFSPPEVHYLAKKSGLSISQVLEQLAAAGLDSLPGGGAEILVDRVRHLISPNKVSSDQWLEVMETAHQMGLYSTATMMMGQIETLEERVAHLDSIRSLQDRTRGFRAFIPWSYRPGNTALGGKHATAVEYLKTLAISRLYLDNIENVQGSWVTQGPAVGQLSLLFGANDLGSIMLEENVVKAAGAEFRLSREEMLHLIRQVGKRPAQRDTAYRIIREY
ncbi:MAG: cyclic dehypoxanthinyl futalosine synthase [Syntrophomonadaceae bacterium]|nr:cyclic dehypoxanthinyl futalosine synthase [Syntrophomonadaceae bacterium]